MASVTFTRSEFEELITNFKNLKGKKLLAQIEKIQRIMENEDINKKTILKTFQSKKPNGLTKPKNAWQLFLDIERPKLEKGINGRQQVQEISKKWKAMTDDEKKPFQDKAKEESERYKEEKAQLSEESENEEKHQLSDGDIIDIDEIEDDQDEKPKAKSKTKKMPKEKYNVDLWGDLDDLTWTRYENDAEYWEYATDDNNYIIREGKVNGKVKISDKVMKSEKAVQRSLEKQIVKKEEAGFLIQQ